jgi:ElaB/YqjD/DUF883 family membrane-anchored ribosome-binding protein
MNREKRVATAEGSFTENMRELAAETAHQTMDQVRHAAGNAVDSGRRKIAHGIEGTERFVTQRPFKALAIAIGAGVVIGYLLHRRRD